MYHFGFLSQPFSASSMIFSRGAVDWSARVFFYDPSRTSSVWQRLLHWEEHAHNNCGHCWRREHAICKICINLFSSCFILSVNCNIIFDPRCVCICLPTVGNIQSPSAANLATLQSYRPLVNDVYAPPSLGFTQVQADTQIASSNSTMQEINRNVQTNA